ncbi:putative lipoyltransferase 2, mitochondrial [Thalassophryne amazonica]|uniref:putative lipoyltransferase 2, mitochondrial n=1 Tax=Thalassophryne amazonica TaxID=390379 RepID=UPI0014722159|nr:putative lipoyltransferase 2, mitochondrial [Thalassophryne amazonica]XP_034024599.1 putative lipoyltransferase 2, mitochondrial [Thalassophryne amazonica]
MQRGRPLVEVVRMGLVSYQEALRVQQVYVSHSRAGPANTLLLCHHPPVYTTGIRQEPYPVHMLDSLRLLGAEVHQTNRGGLVTFHGPGQLVCYPILNLACFKKSVRWYVGELEKMIISVCAGFGIEASSSPHTGVWVGENKICAIGIHCGRYITSHGLALNCNTDLSWFSHIVPCGVEGKGVTSLSAELQRDISTEDAVPLLLDAFRQHFNCTLTQADTTDPRPNPESQHGPA